MLTFPVPRSVQNYAEVQGSVPANMRSFTVSFHMKSSSRQPGTVFSYATRQEPHEIGFFGDSTSRDYALIVQNQRATFDIPELHDGRWHMVVLTWRSSDGQWTVAVDGQDRASGRGLAVGRTIRPGGTWILGQDQDSFGNRFEASQAYVGDLAEFHVFDTVLSDQDLRSLYSLQKTGDVIDMRTSQTNVRGSVRPAAYSASIRPTFGREGVISGGTGGTTSTFPSGQTPGAGGSVYMLTFPQPRSIQNYARISSDYPFNPSSFTVSFFMRVPSGEPGTVFAYVTDQQAREVAFLAPKNRNTYALVVNNQQADVSIPEVLDGQWHVVVITWENTYGQWTVHVDGQQRASGSSLATGHTIRPGGVWFLGQSLGDSDGFDQEFFTGDLSEFRVFDTALPPGSMRNLYTLEQPGSVINWRDLTPSTLTTSGRVSRVPYRLSTSVTTGPGGTRVVFGPSTGSGPSTGVGPSAGGRPSVPTDVRPVISEATRMLSFPAPRSVSNYAQVVGSRTFNPYAFTVSFLMRTPMRDTGTIFSYAVPQQPHELAFVGQEGSRDYTLIVNGQRAPVSIPQVLDGNWHVVAILWQNTDGQWRVMVDGQEVDSGTNLARGHTVRSGGTWILGQEQNTMGANFKQPRAYVGDLAEFNVHYNTLPPADMRRLYALQYPGDALSWRGDTISPSGPVGLRTYQPNLRVTSDSRGGSRVTFDDSTTGPGITTGTVTGHSTGISGMRGITFPTGMFLMNFPEPRTSDNYAELRSDSPFDPESFTISFHMRTPARDTGTIFSYGTRQQPHEIGFIGKRDSQGYTFIVDNEKADVNIPEVLDGQWHVVAITWRNSDGQWSVMVDGEERASGSGLARGHRIRPGGTWYFGQDVSRFVGTRPSFERNREYVGDLAEFHVHNKILSNDEMRQLYSLLYPGDGVNWRRATVTPRGQVQQKPYSVTVRLTVDSRGQPRVSLSESALAPDTDLYFLNFAQPKSPNNYAELRSDGSFSPDSFTISFHMRTPARDTGTIFSYGTQQQPHEIGFAGQAGNRGYTFMVDNQRANVDIPEVLDGQWHVVAITWRNSDGQWRVMVDGEERASGSGLARGHRIRPGGTWYFGQDVSQVGDRPRFERGREYEGDIAEFHVHNKILSNDEMRQLYSLQYPGDGASWREGTVTPRGQVQRRAYPVTVRLTVDGSGRPRVTLGEASGIPGTVNLAVDVIGGRDFYKFLNFPQPRSPNNYAELRGDNSYSPESFTISFHMRTPARDTGTIFSYGTQQQPNEIGFVGQSGNRGYTFMVDNQRANVDIPEVLDGQWHVVAITWRNSDGQWRVMVDGEERASGSGLARGHRIRPGGTWYFGQDVSQVGDRPRFERNREYEGDLAEFHILNRDLSNDEMRQIYSLEYEGDGENWRQGSVTPRGQVQSRPYAVRLAVDGSGRPRIIVGEASGTPGTGAVPRPGGGTLVPVPGGSRPGGGTLRPGGPRPGGGGLAPGAMKFLTFPEPRSPDNYVDLRSDGSFSPESFTISFHMRTPARDTGTIFSYGTQQQPHEIGFVGQSGNRGYTFMVDNQRANVDIPEVLDGQWHVVAITWRNSDGQWRVMVDGEERASGSGLARGHRIRPGGTWYFGQDVSQVGDRPRFERNREYVGDLAEFHVYNRVLSPAEMLQLYRLEATGDGVNWRRVDLQPRGQVQQSPYSVAVRLTVDGRGQPRVELGEADISPGTGVRPGTGTDGGIVTPTGMFMMSFPESRSTDNYAELRSDSPFSPDSFTISFHMRTPARDTGTIFSYGTQQQPNEIGFVGQAGNRGYTFMVDNQRANVDIPEVLDGQWHVVAITWRNSDGQWRVMVDGEERASGSGLARGHRIRPGGTWYFGQDVSQVGDRPRFERSRGYEGDIAEFHVHNRVLSGEDMRQLYTFQNPGDFLNWRYATITPRGQVQRSPYAGTFRVDIDSSGGVRLVFLAAPEVRPGSEVGAVPGATTGSAGDVIRPEGMYLLNFPRPRSPENYAEVRGENSFNPESFTISFHMRTPARDTGTIFSYGTQQQPHEIGFAGQSGNRGYTFMVDNQRANVDIPEVLDGQWHVVTITWRNTDGLWRVMVDGEEKASGSGLARGHRIRPGGTWYFGQDVRSVGPRPRFERNREYVGDLAEFQVYTKVLSPEEMLQLYTMQYSGDAVNWRRATISPRGRVQRSPYGGTFRIDVDSRGVSRVVFGPSTEVRPGSEIQPAAGSSYILKFPSPRSTANYANIRENIPFSARGFTLSWHMRTDSKQPGTIVSYATSQEDDEVEFYGDSGSRNFRLLVNGEQADVSIPEVLDGAWHMVTVTWQNKNGEWNVFVDGQLKATGNGLAAGHTIRPGGTWVLGQDQDTVGNAFQATEAYTGDLSELYVFDMVLPQEDMNKLAAGTFFGNVINWRTAQVYPRGGVRKTQSAPRVVFGTGPTPGRGYIGTGIGTGGISPGIGTGISPGITTGISPGITTGIGPGISTGILLVPVQIGGGRVHIGPGQGPFDRDGTTTGETDGDEPGRTLAVQGGLTYSTDTFASILD
ncbi:PREDICTED: uncharacterized protein LOC109487474 [Branchiostoma belcheri]|uniref:Uncharacterized protein LOC109487474 n=1 Tax=Branchiostoma belcheri TaxID=7741 RepID=A0A6P5ABK9_BRABE|nr:PREDICTED: uncharacterized protein LOC109487474 [Branchiostoma belcheri]